MNIKEYWDKATNQRLIVETEDRLARKKAHRDAKYNLGDVLSLVIETNPYIGESVAMAKAYDEELKLIVEEINRNSKRHH